jgi:YegS/Rv2252/BmrU family lipid kinase
MWWVVANPSAGRKGEIEQRTTTALRLHQVPAEVRVSTSAAHVTELVAEGVAAGASQFAAVGGDGTANLVLNAVMGHPWERPPALAILPAGSGSDFVRTFALPRRLEDAVPHLLTDTVYPTDIGVLEGSWGARYFLNAANAGITAGSVQVAERLPRWLGGARYAAGFWITWARFPAARVVVSAGERSYEGTALAIVVANGQFFGGGMNVAPRATVMDGRFDLQVFAGPRRQAFSVMPRVMRGLHLQHKGVHRYTPSSFTIESSIEWPVEVDGEVLSVGETSITGRIIPAAITFKI